MRGLVDLSGGVGRRRNECALLGIAWESGQENAARCICHLSALRCPLQRAAFAIAPRSVLSAISIRRLSRRFLRFLQKLKPVTVRAAGRASFPPSLPQPQPFLLPVALPCHFFPSILRWESHVAVSWPSWCGVCSRKMLLCWEQICISGKVAVTLPHAYIYNKV